MREAAGRAVLIFALIGLGTLVSACAMVRSNRISADGTTENGTVCSSDAGMYYLPKTLIHVTVTRAKAEANGLPWHRIEIKRKHVPDERFGYCLDYLASHTSNDYVFIKKYNSTHLLGVIMTDAQDQSRLILETLIQTIFVAISGNPAFTFAGQAKALLSAPGGEVEVFRGDLDPFDPADNAKVNGALNDFGFCLILEHYSFDLRAETIDHYCDDPEASLRRAPKSAPSYDYDYVYDKHGGHLAKADHVHKRGPGEERSSVRGIFYRPRIPYSYYLFIKQNRQARGGWRLASSAAVEMSNIAPVISVGIERAAFTQRRTGLVFDEGTLRDVCVFKGSELAEGVKVPLALAKSVVALPANIVQVRINQASGKAALANAERDLIRLQKNLIETERVIQGQIKEGDRKFPALTQSELANLSEHATPPTAATGNTPGKTDFPLDTVGEKQWSNRRIEDSTRTTFESLWDQTCGAMARTFYLTTTPGLNDPTKDQWDKDNPSSAGQGGSLVSIQPSVPSPRAQRP